MDTIRSTQYHAIYSDLRNEEFIDKESALKAGAIFVVEEIFGTIKNGGYTNRKYIFNFYNVSDEAVTSLIIDKWVIRLVVTNDNFLQMERIQVAVTDPMGKIQPLQHFGVAMAGVISALKSFKKMIKYESFQNYSLSIKILELEEEIKNLKPKAKKI